MPWMPPTGSCGMESGFLLSVSGATVPSGMESIKLIGSILEISISAATSTSVVLCQDGKQC